MYGRNEDSLEGPVSLVHISGSPIETICNVNAKLNAVTVLIIEEYMWDCTKG